ncbi:MAG: Verru_Chthon cassette protein D [Verrucomicrobiae bacterium]
MSNPRSSQHPAPKGFSLVEMLTVIAIIGILGVLAANSMSGLLGTYDLSSAGQAVMDELSLARQMAITENRVVEFQIYKLKTGTLDSPEYCAMALVKSEPLPDGSGSRKVFLRKVSFLPTRVIFDSSATFSSLLLGQADEANPLPFASTVPAGDAPTALQGQPSLSFRFRPDGSLDLEASDAAAADPATRRRHWTLTLRGYRSTPESGSSLPAKNFITITLDPLTGKAVVFQP